MSKENVKTVTATETVTETAAETAKVKAAPLLTMTEALLNAEKENRSFKLYRSWYYSERKEKNYYSYNVYLRLFGTVQKFMKIELIPDVGYTADKENKSENISKNISAYNFMHLLYDMGSELRLYVRSNTLKDEDGKENVYFSFIAESNDGSVNISTRMKTRNKGSRGYLEAAFVGFGKLRGINDKDYEELPELREEFLKILMPGELPPEQVDSGIE